MVVVLAALAACSAPPKTTPPGPISAASWDEVVEKHVHDAARAGRLKVLGRQLVDLQRELATDVAALNEQAVGLNANPGATKEQARAVLGAFEEKRRVAFARYRDIVFAMRAEVTPTEWRQIMKD
jgi:hypothetical protein